MTPGVCVSPHQPYRGCSDRGTPTGMPGAGRIEIERKGGRPLRFRGRLLAQHAQTGGAGVPGFAASLYRTDSGTAVVALHVFAPGPALPRRARDAQGAERQPLPHSGHGRSVREGSIAAPSDPGAPPGIAPCAGDSGDEAPAAGPAHVWRADDSAAALDGLRAYDPAGDVPVTVDPDDPALTAAEIAAHILDLQARVRIARQTIAKLAGALGEAADTVP